MPSGSPRSKLANCVSPHEDSGGTGNRSIMTTFADARVSAVKQRGKRGNLHEAMGRAFPAWAANAAHIQLSTRGKNFWKSSGVIGPAFYLVAATWLLHAARAVFPDAVNLRPKLRPLRLPTR